MRVRSMLVAFLVAAATASPAGRAEAQGTLPEPFVLDAAMSTVVLPGDDLALLGGSLRLTYRPTPRCLHVFVDAFAGSTLEPDVGSIDATLVRGSLGALWGAPHKRTFFAVGVAVDLGYARLAATGADESGFTSSVGMRALLRNRLAKAFHVHAALMLGAVVKPRTIRFATSSEGIEGLILGLDLGASFDLGRGR